MATLAQITCPHCSNTFEESVSPFEAIPELPCPSCKKMITRKKDDHCVICSYGNTICPTQQSKRDCCSG